MALARGQGSRLPAIRAAVRRARGGLGNDYMSLPEPGFFRVQLTRKGAFVAALIFMPCPLDPEFGYPLDRPRRLTALIGGKPAENFRVWCLLEWGLTHASPEWIWRNGQRIDEPEYLYMIDYAAWAKRYAPREPEARPTEKINIREAKFF